MRVFRRFLTGFFLVLIMPLTTAGADDTVSDPSAFSFERVVDEAQELSHKPFVIPTQVPDFLSRLSYDEWRDIRFKPDKSVWQREKLPFQLQFFHPGFLYQWPVEMAVIDRGVATPLRYSPAYFDFGSNNFDGENLVGLDFAGFRIHHPINSTHYFDEFAVFLGASYFRAVAAAQGYGLSARGLAVNTALDSGEEFPFFKKFWIVRPYKRSQDLTVYALLDSVNVTGAYEFVIKPGKRTEMTVRSLIFLRNDVKKIGFAPLTSMFFHGENSPRQTAEDFRPEVHDSDGLLIWFKSGEWIWRPLVNPHRLFVNSFAGVGLNGFGLFQRDENYDHYQDLEARYDQRPSAWVEPLNDWGAGHVELVQIPTHGEMNDNIVAYWVPDKAPLRGSRFDFSYRLTWAVTDLLAQPGGRVCATRMMRQRDDADVKFVIDFEGDELKSLGAASPVAADVQVTGEANIVDQQVYKNAVTGGWRLVFRIKSNREGVLGDFIPSGPTIAELRAFLTLGQKPLTETWSYAIQL